jgi:hypothetical protein
MERWPDSVLSGPFGCVSTKGEAPNKRPHNALGASPHIN